MSEIIERSFRGEWIENIPDDWKQSKIKHLFAITKNIAGELGHSVLSITQRGAKIKDTESGGGQLSMDYSKYQLVETGNFLMNHMDLLTGYVDISKYDGVTSPDYRVFKIKNTLSFPQYFLYVFQHCYKSKIFYAYGRGSSQLGRWRLPTVEFENFYLPLPPIEEQKLISRYLDKKTEQIDRLVNKIQKKIELLKEQRTSLINQCVTKGLDPNVEMKDSGVEWIGEIPKHWTVSPMFTLFDENRIKNRDGRLDVLTLSYGKIKYRDLSKLEGLFPASFDGYQVMSVESIIIRSTDLQNDHKSLRVGHVGIDGVITSAYLGLNPKEKVSSKFYYYSIHLADLKKVLYGLGGGLRQSLRYDDFKRFPVINPPEDERNKISKHLDDLETQTKHISIKLKRRIILLNEYRQSLISSVVTGKVKVTEDMM